MNWKTLILGLVLADMLLLTGYALWQVGYLGLFAYQLDNWGGVQVLVDLVIACALVAAWMYKDARRRGVSPWPYLVLTLFAGSIGPLVYLLRRGWRRGTVAAPASA